MTKFRIIEIKRGFYVEQSARYYGEMKWGARIGPIPTREEAEELMLELRVDVMMEAEDAAESVMRYCGC